ncbi:serine hydrolase domain-containing protein [Singulisphaera sp. Ch08]|uniref:Serine hydrolase domain-containing protein n=1 Tax=Singulisphaera sp. Ch08 TaxID=3120278 RepID=A0AAU7C952_9BACT
MIRLPPCIALTILIALPQVHAGELPKTEPEAVGFSAAKLADLKPALQKLVDEGKISGGVTLAARHGKVACVIPFGYRDLAAKTPMTEDTIFAIASMTKPVTCAAVLRLVDDGVIGLDDPVEKFLPELKALRVLGDPQQDTKEAVATVPVKRSVTVRDLLSQTAGFAYGALTAGGDRLGRSYAKAKVHEQGQKTIAELVNRLAQVPLAHQPGEGWTYGYSHDVLGRLVEASTGQSFADYLRSTILGPLDMHDTSFSVPDAKWERMATIYQAEDDGTLTPIARTYGSETYFSGGSGLFSTARDYSRFAQMLLNGGELDGRRILKPETVAAMTTNQIGEHSAFGGRKYGLGLGLLLEPGPDGQDSVLVRYYWGGVYSTHFWVDPRHDLLGITMTQMLPTDQGEANRVFHMGVNDAIEK